MINILIALLILVVILYIFNSYVVIDITAKRIINLVIIVAFIIWLFKGHI